MKWSHQIKIVCEENGIRSVAVEPIRFIAFKHSNVLHLDGTSFLCIFNFLIESENIMKLCMAEEKI